MRQDLYEDLFQKEREYWWHVGKRLIVYRLLAEHFRPNGGTRALDLGCGAGFNLEHLARFGTAVGLDSSAEALEFCRRRGLQHLCLGNGQPGLPFRDREFAVVTALDVLEHLDDDVRGAEEIWRVLRPGGWLVASVPAFGFLWSYWDEILGHRRRYRRSALEQTLAAAGFEVVHSSYTNVAIFGPAVAMRAVRALRFRRQQAATSDFVAVPGLLNRGLIACYDVESRLVRRHRLPFGLSVICLARKPDVAARGGP